VAYDVEYYNQVHLIPQFSDVSEVISSYSVSETTKLNCKTEFCFATTMPHSSTDKLIAAGFTAISRMNNWYPSHAGHERAITFWWKKFLVPVSPVKAERKSWGGFYNKKIEKYLSASGCGFSIHSPKDLDDMPRDPFFRYFTLMRMPIEPSEQQYEWLEINHFRHITTGTQSSFWINGWDPAEYTWEREQEFFKSAGVNLCPTYDDGIWLKEKAIEKAPAKIERPLCGIPKADYHFFAEPKPQNQIPRRQPRRDRVGRFCV
jgi:hypothetical protein